MKLMTGREEWTQKHRENGCGRRLARDSKNLDIWRRKKTRKIIEGGSRVLPTLHGGVCHKNLVGSAMNYQAVGPRERWT